MDFTHASHTAIISDMHLCEAEKTNEKFPLWKKYKTEQFFFDDVFADFLSYLHKKANGKSVELILNGDIFDFDSVMKTPTSPAFRMHWLERLRGLRPRAERSLFKMNTILEDHFRWAQAMNNFLMHGHRVVFVIGNHDLELHYAEVQETILKAIAPDPDARSRVRFVEWFYISNKDTLIEHGNQYDPYCLCEDPLHPFVRRYRFKEIKLPFGNMACRYILNGMGFFNPHVDKNYIMSIREYVLFFYKYMIRAQPLLMWTWFWGAVVTLVEAFTDRFAEVEKDPLRIEDRINWVAKKANAEPRMVRELKELFVDPAGMSPILLARELWLDRAFMVLISFYFVFVLFLLIKQIFSISVFWMFIPLFVLLPFFIFYSKSVQSLVSSYKEPDDRVLNMSSLITKTNRIVYGHTHLPRHEIIGAVEHLNSGCWSPAFLDVECTRPIDQKTFVWITPSEEDHGGRQAELYLWKNGDAERLFNPRSHK